MAQLPGRDRPLRTASLSVAAALLLLCLLPVQAWAQAGDPGNQSKRFGDYRIYYAAQRSDALTPAVAEAYAIRRSRNRGYVMVNVRKLVREQPLRATEATVKGRLRDLLGHSQSLSFRAVTVAGSTSYVAEFMLQSAQTLVFDLDVTPTGVRAPVSLQFRQSFYTD